MTVDAARPERSPVAILVTGDTSCVRVESHRRAVSRGTRSRDRRVAGFARGAGMTAREEPVQGAATVAIPVNPEPRGVVARLARGVELPQVHVCMARAAFLRETRVANGRSHTGRERPGFGLVAFRALRGFVMSGQGKRGLTVREGARNEAGLVNRMTRLAPLVELPQVDVTMATDALSRQRRESRYGLRLTGARRNRRRLDVAALARHRCVLSLEERRRPHVRVSLDLEIRRRVAALARVAQLSGMRIDMARAAGTFEPPEVDDRTGCP